MSNGNSGIAANAQTTNGMVGINTNQPKATLHIEAGASENKGLIIPRITPAEMKTMSNQPHFGQDQDAIPRENGRSLVVEQSKILD